MLVLSRKIGERIRIGDSVTVTVVRVSGGGVRLGIDAPPELPVVREELLEQLERRDRETRESSDGQELPTSDP